MESVQCGDARIFSELESLYSAWGGPSWERRGNWTLRSVSFCNWEGISCSGNNVTGITLHLNNLQGNVGAPHLPCIFETIVTLDLYGNTKLGGSLPATWSAMRKLQRLDLSDNLGLSGGLPLEWDALTELRYLYAYNSGLQSTLPPWISLKKLRYVSL